MEVSVVLNIIKYTCPEEATFINTDLLINFNTSMDE